MIGTGRYSAEHWVHSHPSIQACDLSTSDYLWNNNNIPEVCDEFELQAAPRYDWNTFLLSHLRASSNNPWFQFEHRWAEYKALYNETPPASWFGWKFYNDSIPADFRRPTSADTVQTVAADETLLRNNNDNDNDNPTAQVAPAKLEVGVGNPYHNQEANINQEVLSSTS